MTPKSMEWVNISKTLSGHPDSNLITYMLSPFDNVLNEAEAEFETMQYCNLDNAEKIIVEEDFISFFNWFGESFLFFKETHQSIEIDENECYEMMMVPKVINKDLTYLVPAFLSEINLPSVFHIQRNAFVLFCHDMSVMIFSTKKLPKIPELKKLKCINLPVNFSQ